MTDHILRLPGGRSVSFADYGDASDLAVLWCHGGPGNRLEPMAVGPAARQLAMRLIGIDRPGYGESTPVPGRRIGDWAADGLAVADHLGIERFIAVGISTGGAYALALAAASRRVLGVIACCAVSDMRWAEGKAMMTDAGRIWSARDRVHAIAIAEEQFGHDGGNLASLVGAMNLPPADLAMLSDPAFAAASVDSARLSFAQGVAGYVDDRLADGPGWGSIDLAAIRCPVIVLHGEADTIVPIDHARYTARIVPGAMLEAHPDLGHFSIIGACIPALAELRRLAVA